MLLQEKILVTPKYMHRNLRELSPITPKYFLHKRQSIIAIVSILSTPPIRTYVFFAHKYFNLHLTPKYLLEKIFSLTPKHYQPTFARLNQILKLVTSKREYFPPQINIFPYILQRITFRKCISTNT